MWFEDSQGAFSFFSFNRMMMAAKFITETKDNNLTFP